MSKFYTSLKGLDIGNLLDEMGDAFCVSDKDFNIHSANKKFAQMYGLSLDQVIGKNAYQLYPEFAKSVFYQLAQKTLATGQKCTQVGYSINTKKWIVCRTFQYDDDNYILAVHEMSKEEETGYMNKMDTLTSLPNRFSFEEDAQNILNIKQNFGLILIDINRFQDVNNNLGYTIGNKILMEAGSRLLQIMTGGNRLYRLTGDQFLIVSLQDRNEFEKELEKIINIFKSSFNIDERFINLNGTLGYSFYNVSPEGYTACDILKEVETALSFAKKSRVVSSEFFSYMNKSSNLLEFEQDLKKAIETNELTLYYQPQYDLKEKKFFGVEALVRWNHPSKGFIAPNEFLPLAQELNLMKEIDRWVIKKSLDDIGKLVAQDFNCKVAINLSADSISSLDTILFIKETLKDRGMGHDMLSIEITENSLMLDVSVSKEVISELGKKGCKIAIDDFGTGYSSMEYLLRYPSDYLKIDKEFIKSIKKSTTHFIMVSNIIKMGQSLGMQIIAEGIEGEKEKDMLSKMGCDIIQGYDYAQPMSLLNLKEFMRKNR